MMMVISSLALSSPVVTLLLAMLRGSGVIRPHLKTHHIEINNKYNIDCTKYYCAVQTHNSVHTQDTFTRTASIHPFPLPIRLVTVTCSSQKYLASCPVKHDSACCQSLYILVGKNLWFELSLIVILPDTVCCFH